MGHGGTLDPLASGIIIVGIGRGTKYLAEYLGCDKTYETVVAFGKSTDTYDTDGTVTGTANCSHVTAELVNRELPHFLGTFQQTPPIYSALKVNGIKACEYIRAGKELPIKLASRSVHVDDCILLSFTGSREHALVLPEDALLTMAPTARIRLSVSSGFYVRSFAHDLGIACDSAACMTSLKRTRQAEFVVDAADGVKGARLAITHQELRSGEQSWCSKLETQLRRWMTDHPVSIKKHHNGRGACQEATSEGCAAARHRQKFRGELMALTKTDRIKQAGGKRKGKYNQPKLKETSMTFHHVCSNTALASIQPG
ncbi:pseudouridine synthase [Pseudovirgaria hyperparasitica]|uniref:tRNA pseudouridine(55) synthase n=1 Tax=Pseudovirgaria hyperparasitica TaxID=470096 RepID=A0A6A6WMH2_9PEZI|nr:pseudouridine synthase [Pseudovirgaria hyperparasitica]KAF2763353.1 pseudouridine synthase [Pseudovirgaria hyperparasitica]